MATTNPSQEVAPPVGLRNPGKQRRGRNVFLWLAALFVAGQGVSGYLLDRFGQSVRFPSAVHVWEGVEKGPPPDLIWLGSSRSQHGIRPDVINAALWKRLGRHRVNLYNAAVPVGDALAMERVFDGLLARGHRPDTLFVELSAEFLDRDSFWLGTHLHRQTGWADVLPLAPEAIRSGHGWRLISTRILPVYIHRQQLRLQLADRARALFAAGPVEPWAGPPSCYAYGYDYGEPPAPPEGLRRSTERTPYDPGIFARMVRDYRPDGYSAAALERLLTRCDGLGIAVVLVAPPVTQSFRDLYHPEFEARFARYLADLRRRHAFEFHDLRACIPDAGFSDIHHLRADSGAVLFSRVVTERVVVPALERRAERAAATAPAP